MATTPVRVRDFAAFIAANPDHQMSSSGSGESAPAWDSKELAPRRDFPVVGVSRNDALAFCRWLTARDIAAGHIPARAEYRLPTDTEWSDGAGILELPYQPVRSRSHDARPVVRSIVGKHRLPASHGPGIPPFNGLVANVREWTSSPYGNDGGLVSVRGRALDLPAPGEWQSSSSIYVSTADGSEHLSGFDGEGEQSTAELVDLRSRKAETPGLRSGDIGFRVVLAHDPATGTHPIGRYLNAGKFDAAIASARLLVYHKDGSSVIDENTAVQAIKKVVLAGGTEQYELEECPHPRLLSMARSLARLGAIRDSFATTGRFPDHLEGILQLPNGKRYLHVEAPISRADASMLASSSSARLARIESEESLVKVRDYTLEQSDQNPSALWVGSAPGVQTGRNGESPLLKTESVNVPADEVDSSTVMFRLTGALAPAREHHGFLLEWD